MKNVLIVSATLNSNYKLANDISKIVEIDKNIQSNVISLEDYMLPIYTDSNLEEHKIEYAEVTNKLIQDISILGKLDFDKKSTQQMKADLKKIINFIDKLSEVDTDGTEPLIYLSDEVNTLREDEIKIIVSQAEALKNAPYKDSDYFKVPTVLKK